MSTADLLHDTSARPAGEAGRKVGDPAFDWGAALLGMMFAGGLYLDGWAHVHGHVDQSFFTPWHAVLYGGYTILAAYLAVGAVRGRRAAGTLRRALPPGYELSLLGVPLFIVAGIADLAWHIAFGIERSVDALYSPSHLALALGGLLMVSGPLRAAFRRPGRGPIPWPAVLSMTAILSILTFFTQPADLLVRPYPSGPAPLYLLVASYQALGVASVILQSALVVGFVLLAARRFALRPGTITLLVTLNALAVSFLSDVVAGQAGGLRFVPGAFLAGVAGDLLYAGIRRSSLSGTATGLRLLAAGVPALFYLAYFATLVATTGVWWSVHLAVGSVAIAGITGWLLSYAFVPPQASPGESPAPAPRTL